MKLRQMRLDDIAVVSEIEQASYETPWSSRLLSDCVNVGYACRVLVVDKRIVGFSIASTKAGECHILNLCVVPNERKKGYARHMLGHIVQDAKAEGGKLVILEVRRSNVEAIRLYEGWGFREIGERKNYYPTLTGREDALVFELEI